MRTIIRLSLVAAAVALGACSATTEPTAGQPANREMSGYMLAWSNKAANGQQGASKLQPKATASHSGYMLAWSDKCDSTCTP
jgi:hypothetical protein